MPHSAPPGVVSVPWLYQRTKDEIDGTWDFRRVLILRTEEAIVQVGNYTDSSSRRFLEKYAGLKVEFPDIGLVGGLHALCILSWTNRNAIISWKKVNPEEI